MYSPIYLTLTIIAIICIIFFFIYKIYVSEKCENIESDHHDIKDKPCYTVRIKLKRDYNPIDETMFLDLLNSYKSNFITVSEINKMLAKAKHMKVSDKPSQFWSDVRYKMKQRNLMPPKINVNTYRIR